MEVRWKYISLCLPVRMAIGCLSNGRVVDTQLQCYGLELNQIARQTVDDC